TLASAGSLTPPAAVGALQVDPTGAFLYATTQPDLLCYAIDPSTGALTLAGTTLGVAASAIELDPTGAFLYAGVLSTGELRTYARDAGTGALAFSSTMRTRGGMHYMAVASGPPAKPTANFVYADNGTAGTLSPYAVQQPGGGLTPLPPVGAGTGPAPGA